MPPPIGRLALSAEERQKAEVGLVFVTEPMDNSPEGQLLTFVRGWASALEREKIKDRTGRVVIFRSIFRGRLLYSTPGWLLEETSAHVVTAIVPGAQTLQLVTPRANVMRDVAAGREQTALVPWHTNRVVWLMPFNAAHAHRLRLIRPCTRYRRSA